MACTRHANDDVTDRHRRRGRTLFDLSARVAYSVIALMAVQIYISARRGSGGGCAMRDVFGSVGSMVQLNPGHTDGDQRLRLRGDDS